MNLYSMLLLMFTGSAGRVEVKKEERLNWGNDEDLEEK